MVVGARRSKNRRSRAHRGVIRLRLSHGVALASAALAVVFALRSDSAFAAPPSDQDPSTPPSAMSGSAAGSNLGLTEAQRTWLRTHAASLPLCFNPDFPPLEFESGQGQFVGMGADVMAQVEERLGVSFPKRVEKDWNRHLAALEDGSCAIAPTIVQTQERERYTAFTTPYARVPVVLIGTRALGSHLTLDDLRGRRIAVVKGYATESYVREHVGDRSEVVVVSGVEDGLRQVAFGQVDAYVENLAVASHYITDNGITNLQVCGKTDYEFVFRIGVSRKHPELYEPVQKALDDIPSNNLKNTQKRWISLRPDTGLSPDTLQLLYVAAAFSVLLIAGLGLISLVLRRRLGDRMTSLQKAQEELEISRARYRELFLQAPLPLIEFSLKGGILGHNHAAARAFGYTLEDVPTVDDWFDATCPDPV